MSPLVDSMPTNPSSTFFRPSSIVFGVVACAFFALSPTSATAREFTWELEATSTGDIPEPVPGAEQTACLIADFDGDGTLDVMVAERSQGPSIAILFRDGETWTRAVVEDEALPIEAGGDFADIDGDGDLDVSFGGDYRSNDVWWWENPGPPPYPASGWTRRLIKETGSNNHHDQAFGDFDGDGEIELAFWNQFGSDSLYLAEIPDSPREAGLWSRTEIFDAPEDSEGLDVIDIDGDGVEDLVGAGFWFEHTGGTDFTAHTIVADRSFTRSAAGQLVPGGRPEVVIVPGDASGRLAWYEWNGSSWDENVLDDLVVHGHSLAVDDVDADGNLDIFVAEMHTPGAGDDARARIFLGDGTGSFEERLVSTGVGHHESRLADMNGDGILDVVGKPFQTGAPALNVWIESALAPTDAPSAARGGTLLTSVAPNPFNAHVEFEITLETGTAVELVLYDLRGRQVREFVAGRSLAPGPHSFVWDGRDDAGNEAASGTYLLRASTPEREETRAVSLVK